MKNFIFLSPNFPENYYRFCRALKENGMRVLGIGDCPYDDLSSELKESLHEYYKVNDLGDYGEVYRAVAFFLFKYGRADFLESNNEFWLERDARLRTDFNIESGFKTADMVPVKFKSAMKERYRRAGIPVANYCMAEDLGRCRAFLKEAGSAVLKPDNGVGANATYKISSEEELEAFFREGRTGYIMEEFVDGTVCSYDAIVDENGNPVFETGNVSPSSIMDIVNEHRCGVFYIVKDLAPDVRAAGRAALKSFGVKRRFVHFEFFRLNSDCHLGKKGAIVALEVNMRPSGGVSPDLMNYANGVDVYSIWADMMCGVPPRTERKTHQFSAFFGRRDGATYRYSHEEILAMYAGKLKAYGRVDKALSPAMGDRMYIVNVDTEEEVYDFFRIMGE